MTRSREVVRTRIAVKVEREADRTLIFLREDYYVIAPAGTEIVAGQTVYYAVGAPPMPPPSPPSKRG